MQKHSYKQRKPDGFHQKQSFSQTFLVISNIFEASEILVFHTEMLVTFESLKPFLLSNESRTEL